MHQIDGATKVLENIGALEALLNIPDSDTLKADDEIHKRLLAEYYVLRTALVKRCDSKIYHKH